MIKWFMIAYSVNVNTHNIYPSSISQSVNWSNILLKYPVFPEEVLTMTLKHTTTTTTKNRIGVTGKKFDNGIWQYYKFQ